MRAALWVIVVAGLVGGCASQEPPPPQLTSSATASSALAFDPPLTLLNQDLDLARNTHGEAAFAGFEDTTTTYFYVRTDDRQATDNTERFTKEGYSAKVGAVR